jgi:hypothetical protein
MQFPNIDRTEALKQLQLLGYQEGDKVYLRFFYPSSDPRKDKDKGRKSNRQKPINARDEAFTSSSTAVNIKTRM